MSQIHILLLLLAIFVAIVVWRFPRKRITLRYAIALKTMAAPFTVVIRPGVTLPFFFSDLFRNAEENQDNLIINLYQIRDGDHRKIDSIMLEDLPKRPIGMLEVEIRLILNRKKKLKMVVKSDDAKLLKTFGPYRVE